MTTAPCLPVAPSPVPGRPPAAAEAGRTPPAVRPGAVASALLLALLLALHGTWLASPARAQPATAPGLAAPSGPGSEARAEQQERELSEALKHYGEGRLQAAARGFERLARRGHPVAQYNLGVMHLRRELPGAQARIGRHWLEKAAAQGFVTAQFDLGQGWETGRFAARPDLRRALEWYERAALAGSTAAQLEMGTAHYLGRGRPRAAATALAWYRQAAVQGDEGAMYLVASMYEAGEGAAADERLARYWYERAAQAGDVAARVKLQALERAGGATAPL